MEEQAKYGFKYPKIETWDELDNLIHKLSNQFYVRWYSYRTEDHSKILALATFNEMQAEAPLWGQMKEMGFTYLEVKKIDQLLIYEFQSLPINANEFPSTDN